MIEEPYLDNICDWSKAYENQDVEIELLFEDNYGCKSFITGVYDSDLNCINVKILRMFTSKEVVENKGDLIVSCDLDVDYNLRGKNLTNTKIIKDEIRNIIDIVKISYEKGAIIGIQ